MVSSLSALKSHQALQFSESDHFFFDLCESTNIADHCYLGLPQETFNSTEFSDGFLFWLPSLPENGHSISVTSSRLSQKLDSQNRWFDALRTLAVRISQDKHFLVTLDGTTTNPFLKRISELFGISLVCFNQIPETADESWIANQQTLTKESKLKTNSFVSAFFKPLNNLKTPNRDLLMNQIASETYALSVRSGGNVIKSLEQRLSDENKPSTLILINNKLTSAKTKQKLDTLGATPWYLFNGKENDVVDDREMFEKDRLQMKSNAVLLSLDEIKTKDYLLHWTRRRVGAWPNQSQSEYLDDLIFQTNRRNHNELASLCRILASRKLLGTHHLTRDPRDVVCFSDVPIAELPDRRVFRPHLSRWDFESYGVAIDRQFLDSLGAKQVVYGSEADWEQLTESQRPYFQLARSKSESIDWQQEQEWRILGDLNLDDIPHDQAFVFVKTYEEAQIIGELCHWPVIVLSP